MLPHEEASQLLDNPLRNGLLLCDLAALLKGEASCNRMPTQSFIHPPLRFSYHRRLLFCNLQLNN